MSLFSWGKIDRKFAAKNPPHSSLPKFPKLITLNFWDRLRYPPSKACLWIAIGRFYGRNWGCSRDSLRYRRKHSATGLVRQVSRDTGGGISVGSLRGLLSCNNAFGENLGGCGHRDVPQLDGPHVGIGVGHSDFFVSPLFDRTAEPFSKCGL